MALAILSYLQNCGFLMLCFSSQLLCTVMFCFSYSKQTQAQASNLEKKQKKVDQQINEWKLKCDEIQADLDKAQRDVRSYSTEVRQIICFFTY